jgi:hypothetical protein
MKPPLSLVLPSFKALLLPKQISVATTQTDVSPQVVSPQVVSMAENNNIPKVPIAATFKYGHDLCAHAVLNIPHLKQSFSKYLYLCN